MSATTGIEWTDATWNPTTGCTKVSPGCDHCYAKSLHERFNGPDSFETVELHPDRLYLPLRWRKPRRVFVNSMSDLFHKDIPDQFIAEVFATMSMARDHTFQVLTKRHSRMRSLMNSPAFQDLVRGALMDLAAYCGRQEPFWPLPNVWLGVSVENQQWADIRIPALLDTPAAVKFLSCEPLLGPIDFRQVPGFNKVNLDLRHWWVIVGGESGHGARPMGPNWVRQIRDQCSAAGVPFLFKQWGAWSPADWKGQGGATHAFTGGLYREGGQLVEAFMQLDHAPTSSERGAETPGGAQGMKRVGKKKAGRELDGRTWDEYPAVRA